VIGDTWVRFARFWE